MKHTLNTILFATLIATMILLFSSMEAAQASDNPVAGVETLESQAKETAKEIMKLQQQTDNLNDELEYSSDIKTEEIQKKITENTVTIKKLESKLLQQLDSISQSLPNDKPSYYIKQDTEKEDEETIRASISSTPTTKTCYGLINDDNDCSSEFVIDSKITEFVQPLDEYTIHPCFGSSGICATFYYGILDMPGSYFKDNDWYFFDSGNTYTCTQTHHDCSNFAFIKDWDNPVITMTNAPTGTPMETTLTLHYKGLFSAQYDTYRQKQILTDGYSPYG